MTDTTERLESEEGRRRRLGYAYKEGHRIVLEADQRSFVILDGPTEHDWTPLSPEESTKIARLLRSEGRGPVPAVRYVSPHWFALPNGPGSDVGPFSTAEGAWEWIEGDRIGTPSDSPTEEPCTATYDSEGGKRRCTLPAGHIGRHRNDPLPGLSVTWGASDSPTGEPPYPVSTGRVTPEYAELLRSEEGFDPHRDTSGIFDRLERLDASDRAHLFYALESRWCWDCGEPQSEGDHARCGASDSPEREDGETAA